MPKSLKSYSHLASLQYVLCHGSTAHECILLMAASWLVSSYKIAHKANTQSCAKVGRVTDQMCTSLCFHASHRRLIYMPIYCSILKAWFSLLLVRPFTAILDCLSHSAPRTRVLFWLNWKAHFYQLEGRQVLGALLSSRLIAYWQ